MPALLRGFGSRAALLAMLTVVALPAASASAVTLKINIYGPGKVVDTKYSDGISCQSLESQRSDTGPVTCTKEYNAFAGPILQASVPPEWKGGERFSFYRQGAPWGPGEIDCDDAPLAQGICTFGTGANIGTMYVDAHFVDTTAPTFTVGGGPSGRVNATSASWALSSSDNVASFQCSRDGAPFTSCSSGGPFFNFSDGAHTMTFRAKDTSDNFSGTQTRSWTVDTVAKTPTIGSGPTNGSTVDATAASFSFADDEQSTFWCALDNAQPQACSGAGTLNSSMSYSGLADGVHTFRLFANDGLQNSATVTRSWTVDTQPPETVLDTVPTGPTQASATFVFHATEAGSTFQCKVDGAGGHDWQACSSPRIENGLQEGAHTYSVRGIDALGHVDATPATKAWTVDLTPPDTTVLEGPVEGSSVATATVKFLFGAEPAATFECSLDNAPFTACVNPLVLSGLQTGNHTMRVRARDAAGNVDASPAQRGWLYNQLDGDGDGYNRGPDCDDSNPAIHPGAPIILDNNVDENCDGVIEVNLDRDGDGDPRPADCNDGNPAIHRGAVDVPGNGIDEDCNGTDAKVVLQRMAVTLGFTYSAGPSHTTLGSLTVKGAPRGSTVVATCKGKGCPKRGFKKIGTAGNVSLKSLVKHPLAVGSTITVTVTRAGYFTTVKVLKVLKSKAPKVTTRK